MSVINEASYENSIIELFENIIMDPRIQTSTENFKST